MMKAPTISAGGTKSDEVILQISWLQIKKSIKKVWNRDIQCWIYTNQNYILYTSTRNNIEYAVFIIIFLKHKYITSELHVKFKERRCIEDRKMS